MIFGYFDELIMIIIILLINDNDNYYELIQFS